MSFVKHKSLIHLELLCIFRWTKETRFEHNSCFSLQQLWTTEISSKFSSFLWLLQLFPWTLYTLFSTSNQVKSPWKDNSIPTRLAYGYWQTKYCIQSIFWIVSCKPEFALNLSTMLYIVVQSAIDRLSCAKFHAFHSSCIHVECQFKLKCLNLLSEKKNQTNWTTKRHTRYKITFKNPI